MTEAVVTVKALTRALSCLGLGLALTCASTSSGWAQSATPPEVQPKPLSSGWQQLSAKEKRALAPLASRWSELSEIQKGKWRAISQNFDQWPEADKATIHERMTEWVKLSAVQRSQARLNFNTLHNLPKDEKKAKWDEYQSLSPEQKRQLSSANPGPAKTTAPSSKPANAERFVAPPPAWQASRPAPTAPQTPIDKKTLLPIPSDVSAKPAASAPANNSQRDEAPAS